MEFPGNNLERDPDAVGIVGTGSVAQALGAVLSRQGVRVIAIAGRNLEKALRAASFTGAQRAVPIEEMSAHASVLLIAVSDHAIGEVARTLADREPVPAISLHTCGSIGPEVLEPLRRAGSATGVLHPLQTIPSPERGAETITESYYAYCGDEVARDCARRLIAQLGGKSLEVDDKHWALYHAAAVLSINYHVTLVDASLELWEKAGIGRREALEALSPIIRTGVENLLATGPEKALTGPIRRGDAGTVSRHLAAIDDAPPEIRSLYCTAAWRTLSLARRAGLADDSAGAVEAVLKENCNL